MAIHAGLRVGSWVVGHKIADGGMGSVWQVTHAKFGDRRALKTMHDFLLQDPSVCGKFVAEAVNARRIRHPNIVEIFDAGDVDDPDSPPSRKLLIPWLVMEFLDGHDLAHEVRRQGSNGLPWSQVQAVARDVTAGLAAAHAGGVLHLDLKPENLFLTTVDGRPGVKVVDFGISRLLRGDGRSLTLTDRLMSPLWAAPEQVMQTRVKEPADVWALGLITFYLLTGRYYWRAGNRPPGVDADPIAALVSEMTASFRQLVPAAERAREYGVGDRLPPGFDRWFSRCVAYDPGQRFADAKACGDELLALLDRGVPHQANPSPTRAVAETAPLSTPPFTLVPPTSSGGPPDLRDDVRMFVPDVARPALGVGTPVATSSFAPPPVVNQRHSLVRRSWRVGSVAAVVVALVGVVGATTFVLGRQPKNREEPTVVRPPTPVVPPVVTVPWVPVRPTQTTPAPLNRNPPLAEWVGRWTTKVRSAGSLTPDAWTALYTDPINHGGSMPRTRLAEHWTRRASQGTFAWDPARSSWFVEANTAGSPTACRIAADTDDVIVVRLLATDTGFEDAVDVRCVPMIGTYSLRLRIVRGSPVICGEAWYDCAAFCALCPAPGVRRWACCGR